MIAFLNGEVRRYVDIQNTCVSVVNPSYMEGHVELQHVGRAIFQANIGMAFHEGSNCNRSALLVQCCWSAWAKMSETPQVLIWSFIIFKRASQEFLTYQKICSVFVSLPLFFEFVNRPWRLHPRWSRCGIVVDGFSGPSFIDIFFLEKHVLGYYREKS